VPDDATSELSRAGELSSAGQTPPSKKPGYQRLWLRLAAYIVLAYVSWCATLYFYQDRIVFPADQAPPPLPRPMTGDIVVTKLDLDSGESVESWFLPAPQATADHPAPVVVFFHGNAELIDYQDDIVRQYHRLGISALLPEYRGYGHSGGTPSQEAIREDCVRFYDKLLERADVDRSRIVFHGRSLGGGVACDVATRRKPAVLILQSTFASVAEMAHDYLAPAFLAKHPFRNDRVVARLGIPLLIFHGTRDPIIAVRHGRRLRDRTPDAVYIEYDCGHNDWPGRGNRQRFWDEIRNFLSETGILAEGP